MTLAENPGLWLPFVSFFFSPDISRIFSSHFNNGLRIHPTAPFSIQRLVKSKNTGIVHSVSLHCAPFCIFCDASLRSFQLLRPVPVPVPVQSPQAALSAVAVPVCLVAATVNIHYFVYLALMHMCALLLWKIQV